MAAPEMKQQQETAAPAEAAEPEHRMLPPMSHGWALENGNKQGEEEKKEGEGEHRMLPPLSHGWSPEAPGAPVVGPPEIKQQQQEAAAEPQYRKLPPMSHGWALENAAGGPEAPELKQQEAAAAAAAAEPEADKQQAHPENPSVHFGGFAGYRAPEQEAAAVEGDKQQAHPENPSVHFGGFAG